MSTCISRRACADRYDIRLTNNKGENGPHIWLEYRCPNAVSKENEICAGCSVKISKYKYQANEKCNHGIIGGPYHSDSKLYGSAYYLSELKKGWFPSEADEIRAKAAVDKALSSMAPRKKAQAVTIAEGSVIQEPVVQEPVVQEPVVQEPVVQIIEKKKRAYNRKKPVETPEVVPENTVVAEKAKPIKLKTHRSKKILPTEVLLPNAPVVENPHEPKFVEVNKIPITITDFVVVKVKKIKSLGKEYYYDSCSGKVYGVSVNGVGAYKGRYNEEEDFVDVTYPDSDNE